MKEKYGDWIKCEDRIPTEEECEYNNGFITTYINYYDVQVVGELCFDIDSKTWSVDYIIPKEVIAWMPLPKPYVG